MNINWVRLKLIFKILKFLKRGEIIVFLVKEILIKRSWEILSGDVFLLKFI